MKVVKVSINATSEKEVGKGPGGRKGLGDIQTPSGEVGGRSHKQTDNTQLTSCVGRLCHALEPNTWSIHGIWSLARPCPTPAITYHVSIWVTCFVRGEETPNP